MPSYVTVAQRQARRRVPQRLPTVFSKNRQRLIENDMVVAFFNEVRTQADRKNWSSKQLTALPRVVDRFMLSR